MIDTKRVLRAGASLAVAVFLLAACGGDDGGSSQTTSGGSSETTTGGDGTDDFSGVCSGGDFASEIGGALAGLGGTGGNLDDISAQLEAAAENMDEIDPPDEIADDWAIVAPAFKDFVQVLADLDGDFTKLATDPAAQEKIQALSSPEYAAASQNISDWFEENCAPG